jgi:hypothetical protein
VNHRLWLLVLLALIAIVPAARSQESLVPIDEGGKIGSIDLSLEQKLHLFPEYKDFREARLFQLTDTTFVLEISYGPEGKLSRTRLPMSRIEVEELRKKVSDAVAVRAPQAVLDREGRMKLLVGTTLLALFYYGPSCPAAFDVSDGSEATGLYLLTSGTTMILPIVLTRERNVTDAAATLALYGATRGIVHGLLLEALFGSGSDDEDNRGEVTAAWLTSMAEGVAGYSVADHARMTTGHAEMIAAGGDYGLLYGLGTIVLTESDDAAGAGIVLLEAGAGMVGGHFLGRGGDYTRGDSYLFRGAGVYGALLGVTAASAFDPEDTAGDEDRAEKIYTACAMAGGAAGLFLGGDLAGKTKLTGSEGFLVNVGMLGGGLLGLGVMVLADPKTDSGFPYLIASSIGSSIGLGLTYRLVAPGTDTSDTGSAWNLDLAPGLARSPGSRPDRDGLFPSLALRLSCRF